MIITIQGLAPSSSEAHEARGPAILLPRPLTTPGQSYMPQTGALARQRRALGACARVGLGENSQGTGRSPDLHRKQHHHSRKLMLLRADPTQHTATQASSAPARAGAEEQQAKRPPFHPRQGACAVYFACVRRQSENRRGSGLWFCSFYSTGSGSHAPALPSPHRQGQYTANTSTSTSSITSTSSSCFS